MKGYDSITQKGRPFHVFFSTNSRGEVYAAVSFNNCSLLFYRRPDTGIWYEPTTGILRSEMKNEVASICFTLGVLYKKYIDDILTNYDV